MNPLIFLTLFFHELPISYFAAFCLHVLAGVVITFVLRKKPRLAVVLSFVIGLSKELLDQYEYGGFDWLDLAGTVAPSVLYGIWIFIQVKFWKSLLK